MEYSPYNEIFVSSKTNDATEIMSIFCNAFVSGGYRYVPFLNIYKGLPVTDEGEIFDITRSEMIFKSSPLQLAAINHSMETILMAPFLDANILAKVAYVDMERSLVSLNDFSYAKVHFTERSAVRVRLKVPLNLIIVTDSNTISGVIHDISIAGCRIIVSAGFILENATYIAVLFKYMYENKIQEFQIRARLHRISGGPMYECVLIFEHTEATEKDLSLFIYQRQVEILRELKTGSNYANRPTSSYT